MGGRPRRRRARAAVRPRPGRSTGRPGARRRGRRPVPPGARALRRGGQHPPRAASSARSTWPRPARWPASRWRDAAPEALMTGPTRAVPTSSCVQVAGRGLVALLGWWPLACSDRPSSPRPSLETPTVGRRPRWPSRRATPATIPRATSALDPPGAGKRIRARRHRHHRRPRPTSRRRARRSFTTAGPIAECAQPLFDVAAGDPSPRPRPASSCGPQPAGSRRSRPGT